MAKQTYTVPAGTKVLLSLKSGVNTKTAKPGDGVYLVSTFPVIVGSHVLVPPGVYVQGVVDEVVRPGRVKGRAKLLMHFTTMVFPNGQVVTIPGVVDNLPGSSGPAVKNSEGTIEQPGNKGRDLGNVAKGAGIGAEGGVIGGAAAGHPLAGVGYGGLAGAAAGTIYTLFTRGDDVSIPEGTSVEMVMQRPLTLEAAQLEGINDVHGNPQYMPAASQVTPLPKPAHVLCPPDSLGCR
jgi:type IV secretion system protein VirB10